MKIAVIRFSALGDIASMYPVIKSLKYKPTLISTNIGKMYYEDEFEYIICLRSKKLLDVLRLIIKLRKEKFDAVFDFQCNDRSRLITRFLGTKVYDNKNIDVYKNSTFNIFNSIAKKSNLLNEIILQQSETKEEKYIVFNCGSSPKWKSKRLPIKKWIGFSKYLENRFSLPIYLVGDESEYEYLEEISKKLYGNVKNFAGRTTIQELKKILKDAFLTISTDSAAMHISAVQGTPTIGIFGATNWKRSAPYGEWSKVVFDELYYPDKLPPSKNSMEVSNYYDNIDIRQKIDELSEYLK